MFEGAQKPGFFPQFLTLQLDENNLSRIFTERQICYIILFCILYTDFIPIIHILKTCPLAEMDALLLEGPFFMSSKAGSQHDSSFPLKASPFFAGSCAPVACPAHSTGNNIPGGCDCLAGAMVE